MKKTKCLISTLALLSLVSAGASYAAPSGEQYKIIAKDTQGNWKGGPPSDWKFNRSQIPASFTGRPFFLDRHGRGLDNSGESRLKYIASTPIEKGQYLTLWEGPNRTLLSAVCQKGKQTKIEKCDIIWTNLNAKTYAAAELLPSK